MMMMKMKMMIDDDFLSFLLNGRICGMFGYNTKKKNIGINSKAKIQSRLH
jgi:hypothetical protein